MNVTPDVALVGVYEKVFPEQIAGGVNVLFSDASCVTLRGMLIVSAWEHVGVMLVVVIPVTWSICPLFPAVRLPVVKFPVPAAPELMFVTFIVEPPLMVYVIDDVTFGNKPERLIVADDPGHTVAC